MTIMNMVGGGGSGFEIDAGYTIDTSANDGFVDPVINTLTTTIQRKYPVTGDIWFTTNKLFYKGDTQLRTNITVDVVMQHPTKIIAWSNSTHMIYEGSLQGNIITFTSITPELPDISATCLIDERTIMKLVKTGPDYTGNNYKSYLKVYYYRVVEGTWSKSSETNILNSYHDSRYEVSIVYNYSPTYIGVPVFVDSNFVTGGTSSNPNHKFNTHSITIPASGLNAPTVTTISDSTNESMVITKDSIVVKSIAYSPNGTTNIPTSGVKYTFIVPFGNQIIYAHRTSTTSSTLNVVVKVNNVTALEQAKSINSNTSLIYIVATDQGFFFQPVGSSSSAAGFSYLNVTSVTSGKASGIAYNGVAYMLYP